LQGEYFKSSSVSMTKLVRTFYMQRIKM